MVEAQWAGIGRNCGVRKGKGHFEREFQEEGGSSINDS